MTDPNLIPQEPARFSAVLTPHRSLGPKGFMVLMAAVCAVSFGTGLLFYMIGAWPVMGFMGLDVALIYIAFKLNFRALRLYETVDLTQKALTVTRVDPSGKAQSWDFNPYWVQALASSPAAAARPSCRLPRTADGSCSRASSPTHEREDFALALSSALSAAKSSGTA